MQTLLPFLYQRPAAAFGLLALGSAALIGGLASSAAAQITVVNTLPGGTNYSNPAPGSGGPVNYTFTVSGGNAMVVEVATKEGDASALGSSLSWNGVTLNLIGSLISTNGTQRKVGLYYAPISTTGSFAITGNVSTNNYAFGQGVWLSAYTLSGVNNAVAPLVMSSDTVGATTTPLVFTSNIAAGSLAAVDYSYGAGGGTETITSSAGGSTSLVQDGADATTSVALGYIRGLSAGPQTITASTTASGANKSPFIAAIFTPTAAPEPSQWLALIIGALGIGALSLKARSKQAVRC